MLPSVCSVLSDDLFEESFFLFESVRSPSSLWFICASWNGTAISSERLLGGDNRDFSIFHLFLMCPLFCSGNGMSGGLVSYSNRLKIPLAMPSNGSSGSFLCFISSSRSLTILSLSSLIHFIHVGTGLCHIDCGSGKFFDRCKTCMSRLRLCLSSFSSASSILLLIAFTLPNIALSLCCRSSSS